MESAELTEINEKIATVRADRNLSDEQKGERLTPLYKAKAAILWPAKEADRKDEAEHENEDDDFEDADSAQGEDKQANQEIKNLEIQVEDSLRNSFGGRFDSSMEAMGEIVREVFQTEQNFTEWLSETGLAADPAAQIEAAHLLAEIAGPVSREMSIESCRDAVEKNLIEIWGDRAKENMAAAQHAARQIFGSIELADQFFIDRGWGENPRMQVAAMRLLARLARRIPTV
jgi:hypothetical protein